MNRLSMLRYADGMSLAIATIAFSSFAVLSASFQENLGPIPKLVSIVLGAASLFWLVLLSKKLTLGWCLKPIIGDWVYVSEPDSNSKTASRSYALARFAPTLSGSLGYKVFLFADPDDLRVFVSSKRVVTDERGTAEGISVSIDGSRAIVWIIFQTYHFDRSLADRVGYLKLDISKSLEKGTMAGHWVSDINRKHFNHGSIKMVRVSLMDQLLSAFDMESSAS